MRRLLFFKLLTVICISAFSQTGYKVIRTKLPFSTVEKDYYVKQVGNKYVLNGDIIVGNAGQSLMIYQSNNHDGAYIWPKGYVPVRIDASMKSKKTIFNSDMYQNALDAIKDINSITNIRLIPYTNQKDYIRIMYTTDTGYGGISPLGRKGGEQILYITRQSDVKTIIHELLHSLGFWHEQSRYDRDQHVVIDTMNVIPDQRHNFQIEPGTPTSGYDYNSIMHYPANAFAIDKKKPTIRCKNGNNVYDCTLGVSSHYFSDKDIAGINTAYWFNKDVAKRDYAAELSLDYIFKEIKAVDKPLENGVYFIKLISTSKYLDITAINPANGALLQQWDKAGGDNQKFAVTKVGDHLYTFMAMHSNKYLSVTHQSMELRATIDQWDYVDQENQKFYIQYNAAKKGYTIQGKQSRLYWIVLNLQNGAKIIQEDRIMDVFSFEWVSSIPSVVTPAEKIKMNAPVRKLNTIKNQ